MVINKVPKFVEKRIAKQRRDRKSPSGHSDGKKKYSSFDIARKKFEEHQTQKETIVKQKEEKEQKEKEKKKERKQIGKLVNNRNSRGQPNMHSQLEMLMKRYKS